MFAKLTLLEQIAVGFVVIGSIVDVIQFSWIIKRAINGFKDNYKKRLVREILEGQRQYQEKVTHDPLSSLPGSFAEIPRTVLGTKEEDSSA